jgi:hypothetical protein
MVYSDPEFTSNFMWPTLNFSFWCSVGSVIGFKMGMMNDLKNSVIVAA